MAVALDDLIDRLVVAVNPPGRNLYPAATNAEWVTRLASAFWKARLYDFFEGYTYSDNQEAIVSLNGGADLTGEDQQLVIMFAAGEALRQRIMELTSTRAKAGPVEVETQRAASVLSQLLKDLTAELDDLKTRLAGAQRIRQVAFVDSIVAANSRFIWPDPYANVPWVRG